ncbi:MAG: hypothetical protein WCT10_03085 [Patescibacteria group bacterium]|jgi:hypothetical protein
MNWLTLATAVCFVLSVGYALGRLATRAASRRQLERIFVDHYRTWCHLLGRLHPEPVPLGWNCRVVQALRKEVGARLDMTLKMIQFGRQHFQVDREISERLERSSARNLEAASALLDYGEGQVLPLLGRVRDCASLLHGEVEMLIKLASGRYDRLAARGCQVEAERQRITMIRNASAASRLQIAGAPVTTMKLLRVQLRVIHDLLLTADVLETMLPPAGGK